MATKPKPSDGGDQTPDEKAARALKIAESLKDTAHRSMGTMSRDRGAAQIRYLAAPAFRVDRDRAHAELLEGQKQYEAGFLNPIRLDHLRRAFYAAAGKLNNCLDHNSTVNCLIDSCSDPALVERWKQLRLKKRAVLQGRERPMSVVRDLEGQVPIFKNRIAILKQQLEGAVGAEAKSYFKEALAARERELQRLEEELAFARAEFTEADKERLALEAEKETLTREMCMAGSEVHDPSEWS